MLSKGVGPKRCFQTSLQSMCSDSLDSFFTAHVHLLGLIGVSPQNSDSPLGQEASSSSKAIQKVSVLVEKTGEDYGH